MIRVQIPSQRDRSLRRFEQGTTKKLGHGINRTETCEKESLSLLLLPQNPRGFGSVYGSIPTKVVEDKESFILFLGCSF